MKTKTLILHIISLLVALQSSESSGVVDPDLPVYEKYHGVSGTLNSVGSDTLNNMMTLWAESFQAIYPNVKIQIEGKGSSTAPPALIEGTAQLGPMSRMMTGSEIDKFEAKFGYKPTPVGVAVDAILIMINKDNPVEGLSLKQIDRMFSSTYKMGGTRVRRWGELDPTLPPSWRSRPISLYGRNSASGTYGFFKDVALLGGDFSPSVKEQPGSSAVVQGVSNDLGGVGYSGIGYRTSGVRATRLLRIGTDEQAPAEPTATNSLSGKYPLARGLFIYCNRPPGKPLDKLTEEFFKFALSKQGQEIVVKEGYYPLNAKVVKILSNQIFGN